MKHSLLIALSLLITSCASKTPAPETKVPAQEQNVAGSAETPAPKAPETKATPESVPTTTAEGSVSCKHGQDERTVENRKTETGCGVVYTKNGESNTVASASNELGHCDNVVSKIKTNLEAAGFSCQ